ncbi:MAG: hypothetical protein IJC50_00405 [Clostridia bacterium]|nr:hypothetical protein [Clostridia bacterium]
MKKIIARKGALIYLAPAVVFVPVAVYFLMQGIFSLNIANFGWFVVFVFLSGYSFLYVNRYAAVVSFDGEVFRRRGFFTGFESSCPIDSVCHFATGAVFKEGLYLFLIDEEKVDKKRLDPFSKKGYICFKMTSRNKIFLDTIDSALAANPSSIINLNMK